MSDNNNIQGDYTFPNGRSLHFENDEDFKKLFYNIIDAEFNKYRYSINRIDSELIANFLINDIEYELLIPTNYEVPENYKTNFSGSLMIDELTQLNKLTHKSYYENEITKFKQLFIERKSNLVINQIIDNDFDNPIFRKLPNGSETIFNDETAKKICKKIQTPHIRQLLNHPVSQSDIISLHTIAMNCYNKYGGHIITFLLKLPIMPFGYANVRQGTVVFENEEGFIPAFKIKYGHQKYFVLRFSERQTKSNVRQKVVSIFNDNGTIEIGRINNDGTLFKNFSNQINNIKLFIDNFNCNRLFAEVALGNCLNPSCNKPLTDPKSLILGYGKDCAENLGIDYPY